MDIAKIKAFTLKYKWWIVATIAVLAAIVVVLVLLKRKSKGDNFNREQYKTITPAQREKLELLHPEIKQRGYELVDAIQKKGFTAEITSSYRSFEHQQRLYTEFAKKLKPGQKNMAATPGKSPHNYGLALDIVLWKNGKKWGNTSASKSEWEATGVPALARAAGWTWGGDFKSHPFDPVHFDLVKKLDVTTAGLLEKGKKIYGSPEKIIGNKIPLKA